MNMFVNTVPAFVGTLWFLAVAGALSGMVGALIGRANRRRLEESDLAVALEEAEWTIAIAAAKARVTTEPVVTSIDAANAELAQAAWESEQQPAEVAVQLYVPTNEDDVTAVLALISAEAPPNAILAAAETAATPNAEPVGALEALPDGGEIDAGADLRLMLAFGNEPIALVHPWVANAFALAMDQHPRA